ncbi:hypothetical protein [Streptomyces nigra]|uniref:hypothetical protein n=1 Tax=Streptomyces nigra TaxID=1827580 RepID=UPI000F511E59|nr:hypothetical protein [Streptomyces nigra]
MAAAAVVAAHIPAGRQLDWIDEHPSITEWLAKPSTASLASAVLQALEVTLPAGSWFWFSWADAEERDEPQAEIDSLRFVLRPVSEGESA